MKYTKPSMEETNDEKLTYEMREFLLANMDGRLMIHEVVEFWLRAEDQNWMEDDDGVTNDNGMVDEAFKEETI